MEKNNKLPIPQKKSFITNLRKTIFIFLSSIGLASNITTSTYAQAEKQAVEVDYDKQKLDFKNNLKTDRNSKNRKIIKEILKEREQKGLGQYSQDTGCSDKVEKFLLDMLNVIDKNFEMNASKRGNLAITKEEYKKEIISLTKNLDDIILVEKNGPKNQYTECFRNRANVETFSFYANKDIKNDLGIIKKNTMVLRESDDLESFIYEVIHEITHSKQGKIAKNTVYSQYSNLIKMLREGHSNNKAEYIRACKAEEEDNNENEPTKRSLTAYSLSTILYNKLEYFLGEEQMEECMQIPNVDLYNTMVKNVLEEKYGKGTTLNLYKKLTNLSLYFFTYDGEITNERIDKIYKDIEKKNLKLTRRLQKGDFDNNFFDEVYEINTNLKNTLDYISQSDEGIIKASIEKENKELKELENLCLKCINEDIKRISSKNETLDYIQQWDYYRNRCCINKNYSMDNEDVLLSENFKLVSTIQHNLYKKCIEYGALNIKSEDIFDRLIESQLYCVQDAKIVIVTNEDNEEKLIISDKYLCNSFDVISKKGGNRKYSTGDEDYYKNKEGISLGKRILAHRDKEIDIQKDVIKE